MIGDEFQILEFGSFVGEFGTFIAPDLLQGRWDFSRLSTEGIVTVSAVPEPSIFGGLLFAFAGLGLRRRRIA